MGWPQTRQDHLVTPRRCQSLMSRGSLSSSSNKRSSSSSTSNAGARKRAGKQTNKKDSNSNLLRPACASIPSAQSWYAPLLYDFLVGSSTNTPGVRMGWSWGIHVPFAQWMVQILHCARSTGIPAVVFFSAVNQVLD